MWIEFKNYAALIPGGVFLLTGLVSLLVGARSNSCSRAWARSIVVVGCLATLGLILSQWGTETGRWGAGMLIIDSYGQFFSLVIVGLTLLTALVTRGYDDRENLPGEVYSLYVFSALGMMSLVSTFDLVFMFVSLELMSLATYVLVAIRRLSKPSSEAALKYFILGGVASAVFLYGVSLLYGVCGSVSVMDLVKFVRENPGTVSSPVYHVGFVMVLAGFLFKLGAVPFHVWIPDVYQGAATSVTGFMISGVKAAAVGAMIRVVYPLLTWTEMDVSWVREFLWWVAAFTMFFGNIMALVQTNIKRMLAYSTIAHTGYILVGMVAAIQRPEAYASVILYALFYGVMSLGAFSVITYLAQASDGQTDIEDYKGLARSNPVLAVCLSVFLFGMAGIPPTAGFIGKYYLFSSAVQAGEVGLTVLGVLASVIGVYYYLRIMVLMVMKEEEHPLRMETQRGAWITAVASSLATLQMGMIPSGVMDRVVLILSQFKIQ